MEIVLIAVAALLSFSNGANDNFKGFATVWGSDTLSYRHALTLASIATVLGSLASIVLAQALVVQFTGHGIVPDDVAGTPAFALSAGAGAAGTVLLATRLGLPISTTHALIGGLVGAGLAHNGGFVQLGTLAGSFCCRCYSVHLLPRHWPSSHPASPDAGNLQKIAPVWLPRATVEPAYPGVGVLRSALTPELVVATAEECDRLPGTIARLPIKRSLDRVHVLSAASICFARGVNDTPKLVALLMTAEVLGAQAANIGIALTMVVGGLLFSRKVAHTMSRRIAGLDQAQGLSANLVTAGLVLLASKFGLPVSTTHVSVGSIAGVGMGSRSIQWSTARNVLLSWVATLPIAAAIAFLASGFA